MGHAWIAGEKKIMFGLGGEQLPLILPGCSHGKSNLVNTAGFMPYACFMS